jgi:2'-5' RNA ligase
MMRLFVGLAIPDPIAVRIAPMMTGLPGARWSPLENLHMTLRFIGEVDEKDAAILDQSLSTIRRPCFDLILSGCGIFAQKRGPEAVWIGAQASPKLLDLQSAVERAAVRAGNAPEERRFRPHVTLARIRDVPQPRLQSFVAGHNLFKEQVPIDHFALFSSILSDDHPKYTIEATYPLIDAPATT